MAKLRQRVIISQSHCSALHCDSKTFAGAKLRSSALGADVLARIIFYASRRNARGNGPEMDEEFLMPDIDVSTSRHRSR